MARRSLAFALWVVGIAVFLVASPGAVSGQSSQGGLRGVVKDAQGVIPGVTVTLVNEATTFARNGHQRVGRVFVPGASNRRPTPSGLR